MFLVLIGTDLVCGHSTLGVTTVYTDLKKDDVIHY